MKDNESDNSIPNKDKKNVLRIVIFILYLLFLLYLGFLFTEIEVPFVITLLILLFLLLLIIGPLFFGLKRSFYSRLFRKKKDSSEDEWKKPTRSRFPSIKPHQINYKYRKPLIRKCRYCGMTVANFMEKCPQCGKPILN